MNFKRENYCCLCTDELDHIHIYSFQSPGFLRTVSLVSALLLKIYLG
jgi:hypothetical protein